MAEVKILYKEMAFGIKGMLMMPFAEMQKGRFFFGLYSLVNLPVVLICWMLPYLIWIHWRLKRANRQDRLINYKKEREFWCIDNLRDSEYSMINIRWYTTKFIILEDRTTALKCNLGAARE